MSACLRLPLSLSFIGVCELIEEFGIDLHHGFEDIVHQSHDGPAFKRRGACNCTSVLGI